MHSLQHSQEWHYENQHPAALSFLLFFTYFVLILRQYKKKVNTGCFVMSITSKRWIGNQKQLLETTGQITSLLNLVYVMKYIEWRKSQPL